MAELFRGRVAAVRFMRKMQGGAQAHLLQADDDNYYVVKFRNNLQHRRVLINELISTEILNSLALPCPSYQVIDISRDFLRENPEVYIQRGRGSMLPDLGGHYGSLYPGTPARIAVFDFIADEHFQMVTNREAFRGMLVFDRWVSNEDGRQCIYFPPSSRIRDLHPEFRSRIAGQPSTGAKTGFQLFALMIDHGFAFGGPTWELTESPLQGLYRRPIVYSDIRVIDDFQPWLDLVRNFPSDRINHIIDCVPEEWLDRDRDALNRVIERLMRRRKRIVEIVLACTESNGEVFPAWQKTSVISLATPGTR